MAKTATVKAAIEPEKKEKVSKILKRLGISHSEAINIYYSLIEEYQGLPFSVRLPDDGNGSNSIQKISPDVLRHLKESIAKNRKLGELLAK